MLVRLAEATVDTCAGKAGVLGALIRAGLPVPDGVVVPLAAYRAAAEALDLGGLAAAHGPDAARRAIEAYPLPATLVDGLAALGEPPMAVRSSASNEDTAAVSLAGRYESYLGVCGGAAIAEAVRACWASLWSSRATADRPPAASAVEMAMAVIVQRHVDAEVSGVLFTPAPDDPDPVTIIEASWGLGPSVVEGRVAPDRYRVAADGTVSCTPAEKLSRLDRQGGRIVATDVPPSERSRPALSDETAVNLARLGRDIAERLGGRQDVEWALAGDRVWVLQARPVTAPLPPPASPAASLQGVPGSRGTATGPARIVRGPRDFPRVRAGDILVCPFTDPGWIPLLRTAAGVVTEVGGVLSHAAIVARELAIPAVLGVPDATNRLTDGALISIDGTSGVIRPVSGATSRSPAG